MSALKPVAGTARALLLPGHEANIAEYYTPKASDWTRWNGNLSLNPPMSRKLVDRLLLHDSCTAELRSHSTLLLDNVFLSKAAWDHLLSSQNARAYQDLLSLVGNNSGEPGLPALTVLSKKITTIVSRPLDTTTPAIFREPMTTGSTQSGRRKQ